MKWKVKVKSKSKSKDGGAIVFPLREIIPTVSRIPLYYLAEIHKSRIPNGQEI